MSHYSRTLKFVKSKKYLKLRPDPFAKFVLLAIARESDLQGYKEPKAELNDEQLHAAVNRETHIYCQDLVKKLLKLFGEKNITDTSVNNYLACCIETMQLHGAEKIIPFLEQNIIKIKATPQKLLKLAIAELKSLTIH